MSPSPPAVAPEYTLAATLGFELLEVGPERATGRFAADDRVKQPLGLVHGGAFAAFAESLASVATYEAVASDGLIAVGLSNHTSFLRPILAGTVHADGRRRHRGRATWLWEVDFSDDEGDLCAVSRVTLAVRPAPGG
ncbi:MAG: PaaI family thioesterase [Thermoleophilaceae bacterium]|nr:PaaI family thioesterase [Thermoleophilaceae bacterium]